MTSVIDMRELICHELNNWSWKTGHLEKLLKMLKRTVAKFVSENYQWKSPFLIDLMRDS